MPGHVCGPATAKAAAAETAQFDERGFPLNDAARAQRDRVPPHIPVPPPLPGARPPSHSAAPRRNIFEILLDPRSIQWLLALGGVLLFTGLVVWLRSLGIFENAFVVAGLLGIGTLALLAGGWSIIRFTRFQLAGRAVTLLACLVMPLNLWFYHANDLLTLDGNLWMAAVVCCVLYAASAWVLKDPLFVYVLMAGIAGTGLLILTDMHKFAEIASPSLLLVILGILAIHAERAFPQSETEFSRKRFGLAFFFSGHALLAGGLLLLLGAQLAAWLVQPIFPHWDIPSSVVTTDPTLKLLALAIVLAGTYAYVYSDLFVRKVGAYIYPAAFTLLWAELLALKMLNLTYGSELILATASITALALNVLYGLVAGNQPRLSRHISPLALLLAILPVLYGLLLFGHATYEVLHARWEYQIGWGYVGAMIVCALACRVGAFVQRANNPTMARTYFIFTGAATLLAAAGLLHVFRIDVWSSQVPILMLIPIAYLIASRMYRDDVERESLLTIAQLSTAAMLISALVSATNIAPRVFEPIEGHSSNLLLAIFFLEGAAFYAAISKIRGRAFHVFLATAMAGGAVWQLLSYWETKTPVYILTFAGIGLVMLILSRVMHADLSRMNASKGLRISGSALITLAFLSSCLMVASRMLMLRPNWGNAGLLASMAAVTLLSSAIVDHASWRRAFVVMTIINGALTFLLLGILGHMSGWQKLEIFVTLSGLLLLVIGHIGWYREQNRRDDATGFNLFAGAVLAGTPLLIASVVHRFGSGFSLPDELALVTVSVLMLASGAVFQLRSTTLVGGALLALDLIMLLTDAGMKAQLALGVYLSLGGGLIFLLGLVLAIYREKLVQLPEKVQKREGVFKVLAWR
jgi:hypothetical protein